MSSSRLAWISIPALILTPVMLPPGRARFVTKPPAIGSCVIATIGIVAVAFAKALTRSLRFETMTSGAAHDLGDDRSEAIGAAFGGIALDDEIGSLDVAEPAQRFEESPHPERPAAFGQAVGGNAGMNEGEAARLLLRAGRERRRRCATEKP